MIYSLSGGDILWTCNFEIKLHKRHQSLAIPGLSSGIDRPHCYAMRFTELGWVPKRNNLSLNTGSAIADIEARPPDVRFTPPLKADIRQSSDLMSFESSIASRRQPIKRTVFFAKIIKIRPHVHHRAGCALDEIVRHELAAVPVKIVA